MLQTEHPGPTTTAEFTVTVEFQPSRISPAQISLRLADSLAWTEGVADVVIGQVGEVEEPGYGSGV
jgi:hypothetical protein